MTKLDWAPGDALGLDIPAHAEALREGGADYLTKAFRAMGALSPGNRVTRITELRECFGGGTGRKAFLSVAYEKAAPGLHEKLFVKFSRDFDDERRDRSRHMMEPEVRFAALSRATGFPIAVAECAYADFHHESGTGVLITQRVAYGQDGVEPHYVKCLDYEMPAPLAHYEAIVKALARLAGTYKAGKLSDNFAKYFPLDVEALIASDPIRFSPEQLQRRIARLADFAATYPHLLPGNIHSPSFFAKIAVEAPRFLAREAAIRRFLFSQPDFIALCHWNANVDNAWFWTDAQGELECGLLDWGRVSPMHVAQALYGSLSGAEPALWDEHLDALIALFAREFAACGGPALDPAALKLHVQLVTATMGLAYIMDAPAIILAKMPDIAEAASPRDPRFKANEDARVWLHMMTMFLNLWERQDFGALA